MEKLSDKNPCDTCAVDRDKNLRLHKQGCRGCAKRLKWKVECATKLVRYEHLEQHCIDEAKMNFAMLVDKWLEFYDDIEQLWEWQELKFCKKLGSISDVGPEHLKLNLG